MRRYSKWAGDPQGVAENKLNCIETVYHRGLWYSTQCRIKRGHGPKQEYCRRHAKMMEKLHDTESKA